MTRESREKVHTLGEKVHVLMGEKLDSDLDGLEPLTVSSSAEFLMGYINAQAHKLVRSSVVEVPFYGQHLYNEPGTETSVKKAIVEGLELDNDNFDTIEMVEDILEELVSLREVETDYSVQKNQLKRANKDLKIKDSELEEAAKVATELRILIATVTEMNEMLTALMKQSGERKELADAESKIVTLKENNSELTRKLYDANNLLLKARAGLSGAQAITNHTCRIFQAEAAQLLSDLTFHKASDVLKDKVRDGFELAACKAQDWVKDRVEMRQAPLPVEETEEEIEEELVRHCEDTIVRIAQKEVLSKEDKRRRDEHQLVLDIIEERGKLRKELARGSQRLY